MKTKFISVCKNIIQKNNKTIRENIDRDIEPPIRIQTGNSGSNKITCNEAWLKDSTGAVIGKIRYQAGSPIIKCGAKVVIEFYGDIEVVE